MRPSTARERAELRRLADAVIARHYREPLTTAELARRCGASRRALQRAYAQEGRTTVAEQLRRARLRAGAELLAEQSIAVADVARLVGFASHSAFAAAFARRYGLAPARFRAAARGALARRQPAAAAAAPVTPPRRAATDRGW